MTGKISQEGAPGFSGEQLRRELHRLGLRQADLAKAAGVSTGLVSGMINGNRPISEQVERAALSLGLRAGGREEMLDPESLREAVKQLDAARDIFDAMMRRGRLHSGPIHDELAELLSEQPTAEPALRAVFAALRARGSRD